MKSRQPTHPLLSFALAPYLGQDFFPSVDGGQIKIHMRAQTGTRIEETTKLADRIGEAIHKIIPAGELGSIVDNDRDRGTPRGTTPPTPPGIRVTYHGGSTGLSLDRDIESRETE